MHPQANNVGRRQISSKDHQLAGDQARKKGKARRGTKRIVDKEVGKEGGIERIRKGGMGIMRGVEGETKIALLDGREREKK